MKSRFKLSIFTLSVLLSITLTSCEVFKTTPRSSPDYRGPGSAHRSGNTQKEASDRESDRPTLVGNLKKNRDKNGSRTSADKKTAARTASKATSSSGNNPANRGTPAARTTAKDSKASSKSPSTRRDGRYDSTVPEVVQIARTYTGTPYRSGGNDKNGIDCSGLICQVYTQIGLKVPRISWQQSEFGREVEKISDIRPGDWIFFVPEGGKEGYVSHSGIVTEVRGERDIVFIHASSSRGVIEDNLFSNYFRNRFVKAMRPF